MLKVFNKQLEEDGKIVASRRNLYELQKVFFSGIFALIQIVSFERFELQSIVIGIEGAQSHMLGAFTYEL